MRFLRAIILLGLLGTGVRLAESTSLGAPPQAASHSYNYELQGVYELNGTWYFSLLQRDEKKSFWIDSRRGGPGMTFVSFEPERGLLTLDCGGQPQVLALKKMGAWTSLAVEGGPTKAVTAADDNAVPTHTANRVQPPRRMGGPSRWQKASLQQRREVARRLFDERRRAALAANPNAAGVAETGVPERPPQTNESAGHKQLSDRLREASGIRPAPPEWQPPSQAMATE